MGLTDVLHAPAFLAHPASGRRVFQTRGTHLLQIFFAFLPSVSADSFRCWEAIRRKLHNERSVFTFEQRLAEEATHEYSHDYAYDVERHHHTGAILLRKHRSYNHYIYREACRTTHKWKYHHGYES